MIRAWIAGASTLLLAGGMAAQSFTDVTDSAGLGGPFVKASEFWKTWVMTSGAAVGDYDDDGWDDIFWHGGSGQPNKLFHNNGDGTFTNLAAEAGVDDQVPGSMPLWMDYDNDADLDLFLLTYEDSLPPAMAQGPGGGFSGPPAPGGGLGSGLGHWVHTYRNFLYRNDGDGTFTEVAEEAGVLHTGRYGLAAGDLDGDGLIDLVGVSHNGDTNRMLINQGDGTFKDRTPAVIGDTFSRGFSPHIVDMDGDGDHDVFWSGDFNTSKFFRNDGNLDFVDVTAAVGFGTDENGMGCTVADYDNDGDIDVFTTSIYYDGVEPLPESNWGDSGNRLYVNNGDGTFADMTDQAGVRDGGWGWGTDFGDIDNDGDLDIVMTNGWYADEVFGFNQDKVRVFVNDGSGVFTDQAVALGIDDGDQGRGLVLLDYDHDGALDILISNNNTGLTLYRNDPGSVVGHYIDVELRSTSMNSRGIGAKIEVRAGTLPKQTHVVECGSNYLSQPPLAARFGTADNTVVRIKVVWPNGVIQTLLNVPVDQKLIVTEPR